MKKGLTITYEVDAGLYINITNRCSNNCEFCIRRNGDGAYGSDTLWLTREPTVEEIKKDIDKRELSKYSEVVFCGYGEPSYRLRDAREVALYVKSKMPEMKVRINTNGHSDLISGEDSAPLYEGAFDTVSISLNTPSPERYVEICHPIHKIDAYESTLNFAKNVKKYVQNTMFSVVKETLSDEELAECKEIADKCGVTLKVRTYIPPEK